jgi:CRP-like cAMP-binding protein
MDCLLPTYNELTDEQIQLLNKSSYLVTHKKNEVIFRQNQPISYIKFIKSGLVKIYKDGENDKTIILKIASANNFLGLLSIFYESRYQYSATAIENTNIIYTDANVFKNIISENGRYSLHLLKELSTDAMYLLDKVINVSQKQVTGRLAEVLLTFSQKIYNSNDFLLPVSRTELAELISSTKESISRTLTEFKNDKIIELNDKRIIIKSQELLEILSRLG